MGNLQSLYVKHPVVATEWWPVYDGNNLLAPQVDGWTFVMTVNDKKRKQDSVNLQEVLDHWDELGDAQWMVREWECHPCGTGVDFTKIPPPKERTIQAEESRDMVTSGCKSTFKLEITQISNKE
jgi:hypothetical protein